MNRELLVEYFIKEAREHRCNFNYCFSDPFEDKGNMMKEYERITISGLVKGIKINTFELELDEYMVFLFKDHIKIALDRGYFKVKYEDLEEIDLLWQ